MQLTIRVTNHCYLAMELDRLVVECAFPDTAPRLLHLRRTTIPRARTVTIVLREALTLPQAAAIARHGERPISVEISAEFNSDTHDLSVSTRRSLTFKPHLADARAG